jgi:hypothetical protein
MMIIEETQSWHLPSMHTEYTTGFIALYHPLTKLAPDPVGVGTG